MSSLRIEPATQQSIAFACRNWHYAKSVPCPPLVRYGVWEDGEYIGCVLFSRGASNNIGKPYGLKMTEVCELTRVALKKHHAPVSRIVSIALRMLKRDSPGLRLCISFADPNNGHVGGIYQAMGWTYLGRTQPDRALKMPNGKLVHSRIVNSSGVRTQFGVRKPCAKWSDGTEIKLMGKHRYAYPLCDEWRERLAAIALPYPKRHAPEASGMHPAHQRGEGGSTPTPALQFPDVSTIDP